MRYNRLLTRAVPYGADSEPRTSESGCAITYDVLFIAATLSGFDRLVFRGSLRKIAYPFGMNGYLWTNPAPLKSFGAHVNEISGGVKEAALRSVQEAGRPVRYLQSRKDDKEAMPG